MIDDRPYCDKCNQPIDLKGALLFCRCSRMQAQAILEETEDYPEHWPYDVVEYVKEKQEQGEI